MSEQKKILITGASTPIGLSVIQKLHNQHERTTFVCVTRNKEKLLTLLHDKGLSDIHYKIAECDLSNFHESQSVLIPILKELGCLDAILNIAGMFISKPFLECDEDEFDLIISANLKTTYTATHIGLPYMLKNKGGNIVNISSTLGLHTIDGANNVIYDSVKAAIIRFTQSLAKEFGPSNIRVNCVCPGILIDDMSNEIVQDMASVLSSQPIKRFGKAAEIADSIIYILSQQASWMTGNVMTLNGGINL